MLKQYITIDGNEAVALVAHKINEVIAIYPITPSSPIAEHCDEYSTQKQKNIFGTIPTIYEMQSEGGASGAVHGSLQAGALTTTFTASQGLLLMIPNMYKIAGELTSTVFHVASRSLAMQGLSIFGDHQDVMGVRQTGFALLASATVQEAHDFALIAQSATLRARVPFLHFFDGFRTSHEVSKIELIDEEIMKQMIDIELVNAHKKRALTPDRPVLRGTAQNPDVYFQGRESVNRYYQKVPQILQEEMDRFAKLTGRAYHLFDYYGAEDATEVIVIMASATDTVHESVEYLNENGYRVGVIKVRLALPFDSEAFINALPKTVKSIAVLDRTKEAGSLGEPLYHDVVTTLFEHQESLDFDMPKIIGGRYGLSSKEFTPAMVKAIYDELQKEKPKNHFTIGIYDDVTHTSLEFDKSFILEEENQFQALFYGLGSDGTVGANKNSIKIIGEETDNYAQGYFVYDSNKSGTMTVSHVRFGSTPIKSSYLIERANFIAVHQALFLEKLDILEVAHDNGVFLLNSPYPKEQVWDSLPQIAQQRIIEKNLKFYAINAYDVAKNSGMGRRINTIMQTCFFAISGVLPQDEAIEKIKHAIERSYSSKGKKVVEMNFHAVDNTLHNLFEIEVPKTTTSTKELAPSLKGDYSEFMHQVTKKLVEFRGDEIPVSDMPEDGTWPLGTTQYQKRNTAIEVPVWNSDNCVQCNRCVTVCPHSVIRSKVFDKELLDNAPKGFGGIRAKGKIFDKSRDLFNITVSIEDCTGCSLCVEECPTVALGMTPKLQLPDNLVEHWEYFLSLPNVDRAKIDRNKMKETQFLEPLFEFSGACAGCGETPYLKLASQLFGDRMIVANATGCSSIYGGNLPTTPWKKNAEGRGVAWSNSLFEDNAEFGLGFRLAIDNHTKRAEELLSGLDIDTTLKDEIINATQTTEEQINQQRERVETLKQLIKDREDAKELLEIADYLVKKSVWIVGGDGWAYDIGYGGLDHVLASGKNVNILVLDTQVYSNTGGQQSKATMTGAVAKFASGGKANMPKDLAHMAIGYENVYVAKVSIGANEKATLKAFVEAEAYNGVSIIIAYSHCIAHGYDLRYGMKQQRKAVDSGLWPLFRFNPQNIGTNTNPLRLDYKGATIDVKEFMYNETRFKMVEKMDRGEAEKFLETARYISRMLYNRYRGVQEEYEKL